MTDKIVARAISEVDPKIATDFDLVVIMEDLEVVNRSNTVAVCDEVRNAVERHIGGLSRSHLDEQFLRTAIRTKLSFHLAAPMIESWFFGVPASLTQLGIGNTAYHLKTGDPEQFESTDCEFISADPQICTKWCAHRRQKKNAPKWIKAEADRVFHPKAYLQWLMLDATHKTCTAYREGEYGAAKVLGDIDWSSLLGNASNMPYARSLVVDLADGLKSVPSVATFAGTSAPLTSIGNFANGRPALLRNL